MEYETEGSKDLLKVNKSTKMYLWIDEPKKYAKKQLLKELFYSDYVHVDLVHSLFEPKHLDLVGTDERK